MPRGAESTARPYTYPVLSRSDRRCDKWLQAQTPNCRVSTRPPSWIRNAAPNPALHRRAPQRPPRCPPPWSHNGLVYVPQLREFEVDRYQPCTCCPYGYHIDLDFVRYCEALSNGNEVSSSKQRRRERRRARHSMEVLLGLTSPSLWTIEQQLPEVPQEETTSPVSLEFIQDDALNKAVEVFEDTLQRTHKKHSVRNNTDFTDGFGGLPNFIGEEEVKGPGHG
ncbi:KN motif and ankyrin repeat domain-containing protein 1 [Gryllus bimaculatus]|nr:KN motif and ankyrin repeat domain-containing protein 1 [Gryllus bimaculatus]